MAVAKKKTVAGKKSTAGKKAADAAEIVEEADLTAKKPKTAAAKSAPARKPAARKKTTAAKTSPSRAKSAPKYDATDVDLIVAEEEPKPRKKTSATKTPSAGKSSTAGKRALVIVESPSKAKTIEKYLGGNYRVESSVGHIRDLPKSQLGVDPEKGFVPSYTVIPGKKKVIDALRRSAGSSASVYLATDPDREGEAIAWHIAEELRGGDRQGADMHRVTFNEITRSAVLEAMNNPTDINYNLVNAQQARRILDRLVGYLISPLLWQKVQTGLSAGRVQSVAVRLICDREAEIEAFKPDEYWSIEAEVEKEGEKPPFTMKLAKIDGQAFKLSNEKDARAVVDAVEKEAFRVDSITAKMVSRRPYPPFTTSTLQQEAARKLRFTARMTMRVAQQLYEGVELGPRGATGLITYMRTDSTRVAKQAQDAAREYIIKAFSPRHVPETPNFYKSKAGAQEAHEAIRPASLELNPEEIKNYLSKEQYRLYKIIWDRFLASQMAAASMEQTRVESELAKGKYLFAATGTVILFPGFLDAYEESKDEKTDEKDSAESKLPPLKKGDALIRRSLIPEQHFTQPPPRYSESSLVKELEAQGIGRPSTYAAIIQTIQDRDYAKKVKGRFAPTDTGRVVTELLVENFPEILDVKFTALMEDQLDHVEDGSVDWVKLLENFYAAFRPRLEAASTGMRNIKREIVETEIKCEKCDSPMVLRWGRRGRFLACSAYPDCRNTMPYESDEEGNIQPVRTEETNYECEKCSSKMVIRTGPRGRFLACSGYPKCTNTRPVPIGVKCPQPKCEGDLVERRSKRGKRFYACNQYPKCRFTVWEHPRNENCQRCGNVVNVVGKNGNETVFACSNEECPFERMEEREEAEAKT